MIGTAIAIAKWRSLLPKLAVAFLAMAIVAKGLMIKTIYDKAIRRAEQAVHEVELAKAENEVLGAAVERQNVAIQTMNTTSKRIEEAIGKQTGLILERSRSTDIAVAKYQAVANTLINTPAAAPDLEVPTARAALKDVKGFTYATAR
jgi:hypothetical protein